VNTRYIDWIWHVRGSVELAPGQSNEDALTRLDPLFHGKMGTSHRRTNDTLTFTKKDAAAQDKMSIFDSGVLAIERGAPGAVLQYHMISRMLLFCFFMPLVFIGFAQLTIYMAPDKATTEAASKKAAAESAKKPPKAVPTLNPVDQFLGAPAPEKPKTGEETGRKRKPSPTSAYVLAAIFAALYVGGRILEDMMVKSLFRKALLGSSAPRSKSPFGRTSVGPTGRSAQSF
jgi:hypothetical protein